MVLIVLTVITVVMLQDYFYVVNITASNYCNNLRDEM